MYLITVCKVAGKNCHFASVTSVIPGHPEYCWETSSEYGARGPAVGLQSRVIDACVGKKSGGVHGEEA